MPQPDFVNVAARPIKRPLMGCALQSLAVAAIMLGGAVWLLNRWGSINGLLRAVSILLMIGGAVFLIPMGLYLIALLIKWHLKKQFVEPFKESMSSARETFEMTKKLYVRRHVHREAGEVDFAGLDLDWYESAMGELVSLGYRHLADRVNETVEKAAGLTVVVRNLVSADGTTMAAVYQVVKHRKSAGDVIDSRVCDLESELDDGTFIATSNAEAAKLASVPPQIRSTKHPEETTPVQLHRLHESAKAEALQKKPGTMLKVVRTIEELDAAQQRQQAIKAAFRKGVGFVDPAEVRRIASQKFPGDPGKASRAEAMFEEARRESELDEQDG